MRAFIRFLYRGARDPLAFIRPASLDTHTSRREHQMLDLIMLAIGLAFFALSIGYVYACDRL
jgi:hypothetical protein